MKRRVFQNTRSLPGRNSSRFLDKRIDQEQAKGSLVMSGKTFFLKAHFSKYCRLIHDLLEISVFKNRISRTERENSEPNRPDQVEREREEKSSGYKLLPISVAGERNCGFFQAKNDPLSEIELKLLLLRASMTFVASKIRSSIVVVDLWADRGNQKISK